MDAPPRGRGDDFSSTPQKTFHRSHFQRKTKRNVAMHITYLNRDYLWSTQQFREALDSFNAAVEKDSGIMEKGREGCGQEEVDGMYECVGYANVRLQFCSICFDVGKTDLRDLYYVKKRCRVPYGRQNICHGCLGFKLREFLRTGKPNVNGSMQYPAQDSLLQNPAFGQLTYFRD